MLKKYSSGLNYRREEEIWTQLSLLQIILSWTFRSVSSIEMIFLPRDTYSWNFLMKQILRAFPWGIS